ncbi:LacI family DNA-binding transcriptional regulator [Paraflavitalea sp. CAU 1676]|uniref:LacI family DNA-binding transcriptional regulator n=1 Tax=Paraflavitalea sp. CAU 1676 TaxID=3032598 RepID=UPI0023DC3278|nr:LacI family DNA-binding transcriptional regulator [Paraflavitalea sp. CAU 1676]MDF2189797.1 LacI family DNA-binding transcriptional regulator [Paraflavitalea sp. CAU 1676]
MKRVSLKDIAKLVGASPSTVSFILNGKASQMRISDELKNKVLATAKKMGYQPNQVAVSLRTGQTKILGLLVEDISNNFFASLAKTIEEEAEEFGYKVVYSSTENNSKKGVELLRMLTQRQVDGYLITPTVGMEEDIEMLARHKKPLVLMDRYFPGIEAPYVQVDNKGAVEKGMEHLVEKGYKKIAFITIESPMIQMRQREEAYLDAIAKSSAQKKKLILKVNYSGGRETAIEQITDFLKKQQPDAVFFATNYLGILGLESIRAISLSIPKDLAVVCFDDNDIFRLHLPGITVLQQPVEAIARTAIHILMQQLGNSKVPVKKNQVQLAANLIVRQST